MSLVSLTLSFSFSCALLLRLFVFRTLLGRFDFFLLLLILQNSRVASRHAKDRESSCLHIPAVCQPSQQKIWACKHFTSESNRIRCHTRNETKFTVSLQNINLLFTSVRKHWMAGGHSKHKYIDWWEIEDKIFLLKTYSSTGRVCDFWYSSEGLYSRLGRPDDC